MMNFTSFWKRACMVGLVALPLSSFGERIKSIDFDREAVMEMRQANIMKMRIFMSFSNHPEEAVFPEYLEDMVAGYYSDGHISMSNIERINVTPSETDSTDLYFCIYSPNIILEKGHIKVSTAELKRERLRHVNPLKQCKQTVVKSSIGVDGKPVWTNFMFLGPKSKYNNNHFIRGYSSEGICLEPVANVDPETKDTLSIDAGMSTFWAMAGSEHLYMLHSSGRYLMKNEVLKVKDSAVPDTLAFDFRQAKKVTFGVKDVNGKQLDLRALWGENGSGQNALFRNFYCTGHALFDDPNITYVSDMSDMKPSFEAPVETVDFYAFPGEYYFEFWGLNFTDAERGLCPNGLHGRLEVSDAAEQRVDWDFSKYITLNVKSNVKPGFKGKRYSATSSKKSSSTNRLLEKHVFRALERAPQAYSVVQQQHPGEYQVKIWSPVGYDTIDISGFVHDYEFAVNDIEFEKNREFDIVVPDMHTLRCLYPAALKHLPAKLFVGDDDFSLQQFYSPNNDPVIPLGIFEEVDTLECCHQPGDYPVHFEVDINYPRPSWRYSTDTLKVHLGDAPVSSVSLSWTKAVVMDAKSQSQSYVFDGDAHVRRALETTPTPETGNMKETLFLFDSTGVFSFDLCAPYAVPQKREVEVTEGYSHQSFDFVGRSEFLVKYGKGSPVFVNVCWNGKDGYSHHFEEDTQYSEFARRVYLADKGTMDVVVKTNKSLDTPDAMVYYPFHVDMNVCDSLDVPGLNRDFVKFYRAGEPVLLHGYHSYEDSIKGEVELYYLNAPYLDGTKPLKCEIGWFNSSGNQVRLLNGSYCAVDGQGNKAYFEVKEDVATAPVDFANPPTGVEEVPVVEVPVGYYDLSGRRLAAPRKGVNLIRLQNGRVKKVMVR